MQFSKTIAVHKRHKYRRKRVVYLAPGAQPTNSARAFTWQISARRRCPWYWVTTALLLALLLLNIQFMHAVPATRQLIHQQFDSYRLCAPNYTSISAGWQRYFASLLSRSTKLFFLKVTVRSILCFLKSVVLVVHLTAKVIGYYIHLQNVQNVH